MQQESFDMLPAASAMRLADVALAAAAQPNHRKEALLIANAVSRVLVGARIDMLMGSVMWMAGERDAAIAVLEQAADDPELGTLAQAILALFLASDGRPNWQAWADKVRKSTDDPLQLEMLETAAEIASGAAVAEPIAPSDESAAPRAPVAMRLGLVA